MIQHGLCLNLKYNGERNNDKKKKKEKLIKIFLFL